MKPTPGRLARDMTLWPRLEPLLAKVQKPARYIGCEDGALTPVHGPGKVAWLLVYPDTYEIGLPNQGLQILYEILNERDDAVAERSYAPWVDLEVLLRRARPAAVLGRHPPPGRRLRPHRLQPLGRARLHQRPQLHRPGRRARAGGGAGTRAPADRRRRPLRLQPRAAGRLRRLLRASARARRSCPRSPRSCASGRPAGAPRARRERVLRALATVPGVYVPSMYEVAYDGRGPGRGHAPLPGRARAGREAHGGRPGRLALPEAPAGAAHRGGARPAERRGLPGLHPGLPLLPGRHDHPPGPGAPGRAGAHDGPRRAASAPATTR